MIILKVNTKRVEYMLTRVQRKLPEGVEIGVNKLTRFAAQTYLDAMNNHSPGVLGGRNIEPFRGRAQAMLSKQVKKPRHASKYSTVVAIPHYLVALNSMRTHWVSFKRHPIVGKWAKQKLGLESRFLKSIKVGKHPFINYANRIIGKNVTRIIEPEIKKKLRASKK